MNSGLIAARYAGALLDFANSGGEARSVYLRMKILANHYLQLPNLKKTIENRVIPFEQRIALLLQASLAEQGKEDAAGEILSRFFELVLVRKREELLCSVCFQYMDLFRKANRIVCGVLTMAVPVDDQIAGRLKQLIAGDGARDVELEVRQDPAIIGGFTLEVDMNILDASVAARLKRVRKTLGIIK